MKKRSETIKKQIKKKSWYDAIKNHKESMFFADRALYLSLLEKDHERSMIYNDIALSFSIQAINFIGDEYEEPMRTNIISAAICLAAVSNNFHLANKMIEFCESLIDHDKQLLKKTKEDLNLFQNERKNEK